MKNSLNKSNVFLILFYSFVILIISFFVIFLLKKNKNDKEIIIDNNIELSYGEEYKINIDPDIKKDELVWSSSDPTHVMVDNNGNLSFISNKDGKVTITVNSKSDGSSSSIDVITNKIDEIVEVSGIKIQFDKHYTLSQGDSVKLNAFVYPENATNKSYFWKSSNSSLVSVDNSGNIKVLGNSNDVVNITAETNEGNYVDTVVINVKYVESDDKVIGIDVNTDSVSLNYGESFNIKAIVNPVNAVNSKLLWSSSDVSLVSVDQDGKITAVGNKNGTADIIVKSLNGISKKIKVTVQELSIQNISLNEKDLTLSVGDYYTVLPIISPKIISSDSLNWKSDNENVAIVSNKGVIKAINGGVATISGVSSNNKKISLKVTVKNYNKIFKGYLHTNGTKIVDYNDKPIILKGFNLGAWLSRSYSMSAFAPLANSEEEFNSLNLSCINNESFYQLLKRNPNKFSNEQIQNLSNKLYDSFITDKDFDIIAQTGANVIRLPIESSYFSLLDGDMKKDFERIDKIIDLAKNRGIYVILDLHLVEGRQNSGGWCDGFSFFKNETYMNNAIELLGHFAYRYKDEPAVAGYDILNEPESSIDNLVNFYDKAYKKIRAFDKNHIIFMEESCVVCGHAGVNNSNSIGELPNPKLKGWQNVVYSVHDYPNIDSNKNNDDYSTLPNVLISRFDSRFALIKKKMIEYNIPYYVGEFSYLGKTTDRSNNVNLYKQYLNVWNYAMKNYTDNYISYTPWTYKANQEMYYGLIFYGTTKSKANIKTDSYNTLMSKFSYGSSENMRFNEDFYLMFLNQYGGRIAEKINLFKTNITLKKGDRDVINYTITPKTTIDKSVVWTSSNPKVASVDKNSGIITAISSGTAIITARYTFPISNLKDSKDIYYCSSNLMGSNYDCSKNYKFKTLDYTIESSIEVNVK